MGKGDLRTRRGKIFRGTHGNARSRKREKALKRKRGKEGQSTGKEGQGTGKVGPKPA